MKSIAPWFRPLLLSFVLVWHGQLLAGHLDHAVADASVVGECTACAFGGVAGAALIQSSPVPAAHSRPVAIASQPCTEIIRSRPCSHLARAPPR